MKRRDPFAERDARRRAGGTRPRFTIEAAPARGRRRRDPRAERAAETLRITPRPRLARGATGTAPVPADPEPAAAPRPRRIERPSHMILAVLDGEAGRPTGHDRQVLGAARLLAGAEGAVAVLGPFDPAGLGPLGADRLLPWAPPGDDPAAQAAQVAAALAFLAARHAVFPETPDGGDLARRVAALTGEALCSDIERLTATEACRPARGRRAEQRLAPPRLLAIQADCVAPWRGTAHETLVLDAPAPVPPAAIARVTPLPADPARVPLGEAAFVIAAGNGVSDFAAFRALAAALGATPGASRMVCDAGLMPRAAQVGASGTVLSATCYVAFGIAGAPQHLQGLTAAEHVIAVNTDLHAAMIERADLAIVADAQAVMPALLDLLRGRGRP
ncbi:FAD-binding protein [Zavarzinia compransoris]|uniref:Electron transfer flavoprotein subunit alpha/FixB family protein n=1 Tax=Zavarzinia compransoris TaxID=1264899 RepID=A0A317DTQ7_9PROT|nr:FAD-binding protein [Zavarzinia compransoris]PWR18059.1 electron transfer flavoprotein subunit alpha/FixB family protein [Zavarzinia compransoris]TDP43469.1 electron transfer flavoprotein alpha subunit apoprotein [Zavarzinia compransoris]